MSVDKEYCMSSYLTFRYIEDSDKEFIPEKKPRRFMPISDTERIAIESCEDIHNALSACFAALEEKGERLGIMLSGGMDSACLASYMSGMDAYTFRFLDGGYQTEETRRAEEYANYHGLQLHYVDINWDNVQKATNEVLRTKHAPVHSIEPQIYLAARQAAADGVDTMIVGESADLIFGGMDKLLSQDWSVPAFCARYTFTDPALILEHPEDMSYLFERYAQPDGQIDLLRFIDEIYSVESPGSYQNAFYAAGMPYVDPYANMKMSVPLDLERVRSGESKYLIRDLFGKRYPGFKVPEKVPMPRPVDYFFKEWRGPKRPEFRSDLDISQLDGNQKWQVWCLERFLNTLDED